MPAIQRQAPPLPAHIDDWTRHLKAERTLNDLVEDIHRLLIEDQTVTEGGTTVGDKYRALLRATYDAHAVEGSLAADNILASMMIRKKADEMGTEVAGEKLGIINMALGVVLRRYHASRKQRRNMIGGEEVPDNED